MNRLTNEVSLNSREPNYKTTWLSIELVCVLFYSIVNYFNFASHFGLRTSTPEIRRSIENIDREKHGRIKHGTFGNSLLHEYWIKLDGPKTTMMLQEMAHLLVPLGTPSSKHELTY